MISLLNTALELLSGEIFLGYYWGSKSYYWDAVKNGEIDDLTIGIYSVDNGTAGEFSIVWSMLDKHVAAQLRVYDDGWGVLPFIPSLPTMLSRHRSQSSSNAVEVSVIVDELQALGFIDLTRYYDGIIINPVKCNMGKIPEHMRPFLDLDGDIYGPHYTHYVSIREREIGEIGDWVKSDDLLVMGDVAFVTSERDAILLHLHVA